MERTLIILAALALACSSVDDRDGCSVSADCPVGQYCARTGNGNVCWPDAAAPVVTDVVATCPIGGCRRDSVLHVTATVTDETGDLLDATVALDLPGGPAVAMARNGAQWAADVELRRFPFEHFERSVVATVTARDGARNASAAVAAPPVGVTRLRWVYDAGVPLTAPAVMEDGAAVVGRSATSAQLIVVSGAGTLKWSADVGGPYFITAAPAVGRDAIWVGSEDSWLYGVRHDGTRYEGVGVDADGAIRGSVAVLSAAGGEWGLGATTSGRVVAASTATPPEAGQSTISSAYNVGPAVRGDGKVCAATATATATLRCYTFDGGFNADWSAIVGVNVSAPVVIDAADNVWSGSQDAKLNRTTPDGITETVVTLDGSVPDSPVVLNGGNVVVGDGSGTLREVTPGKVTVWSRKLNGDPLVDEPLLSPLVLTGGAAKYVLPTKTGSVYGVDATGRVLWRHALAAAELRAPNIYTPPGQTAPAMSTAYFSAANGKLFAVIVDGELDASAPWPKAFHDPRNTNRAGPQP